MSDNIENTTSTPISSGSIAVNLEVLDPDTLNNLDGKTLKKVCNLLDLVQKGSKSDIIKHTVWPASVRPQIRLVTRRKEASSRHDV